MTAPAREPVTGFTIDGPESRDIDDAIHVMEHLTGWIVLVHIADVAAAVHAGSALSRAARKRGFTRYLPGARTRPMLPRALSEDRLSLLPGQERKTLTFRITLSRDLKSGPVEILPTLLTSAARLTYDPEQDKDVPAPVRDSLACATVLAHRLLAQRRARGALAIYDAMEARREQPHESSPHSERHIVIQELMILTNHLVGQWLAERKATAMYRAHAGPPDDAERQSLRAALTGLYGPHIAAAAAPDPTHRLGRACFSAQASEHFGLALPVYAQVTSPIRRYADLANHRVIRSLLLGEALADPEGAEALAAELNQLREDEEEARKERHKQTAYSRAERQHRDGRMTGINDGTFRNLATILSRKGAIDEPFAIEFGRRLSRRQLQLPDIYPVIFEGPDTGRRLAAYGSIRAAISRALSAEPHLAVSLLSIAEQKAAVADLRFDVLAASTGFVTQASLVVDGRRVYGPMGSGHNTHEAKQAAAVALILALIGEEVEAPVPAPASIASTPLPTRPVVNTPTPPAPKVPEGPSPVSRLGEIAQAGRHPPPTYRFAQRGSPHEPLFACTCTFLHTEAEGSGNSKKEAKRAAAAALLSQIERAAAQRSPAGVSDA